MSYAAHMHACYANHASLSLSIFAHLVNFDSGLVSKSHSQQFLFLFKGIINLGTAVSSVMDDVLLKRFSEKAHFIPKACSRVVTSSFDSSKFSIIRQVIMGIPLMLKFEESNDDVTTLETA
jgi:hypothetical protein